VESLQSHTALRWKGGAVAAGSISRKTPSAQSQVVGAIRAIPADHLRHLPEIRRLREAVLATWDCRPSSPGPHRPVHGVDAAIHGSLSCLRSCGQRSAHHQPTLRLLNSPAPDAGAMRSSRSLYLGGGFQLPPGGESATAHVQAARPRLLLLAIQTTHPHRAGSRVDSWSGCCAAATLWWWNEPMRPSRRQRCCPARDFSAHPTCLGAALPWPKRRLGGLAYRFWRSERRRWWIALSRVIPPGPTTINSFAVIGLPAGFADQALTMLHVGRGVALAVVWLLDSCGARGRASPRSAVALPADLAQPSRAARWEGNCGATGILGALKMAGKPPESMAPWRVSNRHQEQNGAFLDGLREIENLGSLA